MKPSAKRQRGVPDRVSGLPGEDRISELPDVLLYHILSFIQTIYAVRTCVLSTRWKDVWKSVPNLDFHYAPFRKSAQFKTVGDNVLSFRNSSNIQKFCLNWNYNAIDQSCINRWVHTAVKCNVVELDLIAFTRLQHCRTFVLPECIFMCNTLKILKLRSGNFVANIPASRCFPSLKFLHVALNGLSRRDSVIKLISSCPVLEDLTIEGFFDIRVSVLEVSSPALKTLRICCSYHWYCKSNVFLITCPKLENLVVKGNALENYCGESLVKVSVELQEHCSNKDPCFTQVTSVVTGASSFKDLCLSADCFKAGSLPAFGNLSKLRLVLHKCFPGKLLMELLSMSPHLQNHILEHSDIRGKSGNRKHTNKFMSDAQYAEGPKSQWRAPELVPSCLVSNLETIYIEGFKGQLNTMEVAKYFLRNCEVLKKMTVCSDPLCKKKQALHKELSMVPMTSKACVLEFV